MSDDAGRLHSMLARSAEPGGATTSTHAQEGGSGLWSPVDLALTPGKIVELSGPPGSGLTRLGLSLLVEPSRVAPVVVVDHRRWLSPLGAWEMGVAPGQLFMVRCDDRDQWYAVVGALVGGIRYLYAEVPPGVSDQVLRRLAAMARKSKTGVVLRAVRPLPAGVAHLRLEVREVSWEGADRGHGRLLRRRVIVAASGKGVSGIERLWEVEENGTDPVRLVGKLASPAPRRAAG